MGYWMGQARPLHGTCYCLRCLAASFFLTCHVGGREGVSPQGSLAVTLGVFTFLCSVGCELLARIIWVSLTLSFPCLAGASGTGISQSLLCSACGTEQSDLLGLKHCDLLSVVGFQGQVLGCGGILDYRRGPAG